MTSNRLELKTKSKFVFGAVLLAVLFAASNASAQTTQFTYQGKLTDNGAPINALYDFTLTLWDASTNGNQISPPQNIQSVAVVDGIFTVNLDFGAGAFNGSSRFLEISVKPNGNPGSPTLLSPRQQVLSTPYAIKSLGSSSSDSLSAACVNCITSNQVGSVNGSAISGPIPVGSVPAGSTNYIQNTTTQQTSSNFNISGNGTAGGTLSDDFISASTQYNLGGFRILTFGPSAGSFNLFAGVNAGQSNSGFSNSFFGQNAGLSNLNGNDNSFFGANAGQLNTIGFNNSFFGHQAGINNLSGSKNTFIGQAAGNQNFGGTANIFVGYLAGSNNTSGNNNVFIGAPVSANNTNTVGSNNTTLGSDADVTLNNLNFATAIGSGSKVSTNNTIALGRTNGVDSVIAYGSLSANIINSTTQYNIGGSPLLSAPGDNTILGRSIILTSGIKNSFFGNSAGFQNSGSANSFFGANAGFSNTGSSNSFFGYRAGDLNSGSSNSFFGYEAGLNNSGGGNTFVGTTAGFSNAQGSNNVILGLSAGFSNVGGSGNVFIGHGTANSNVSGFFNTVIGSGADLASESLTNATAIGAGALVTSSNTIALGRSSGVDKVVVYGLGPAGSTTLCLNLSNQISTCSSSLRYKTDIHPFSGGLDIVRHLRPIGFSWKDGGARDVGFGAEEVEKVEPLLTFRNDQGEIEGVKYGQISAVLVNAIKEQQAQIESQQEQLKEQQKQIETLLRFVYRLAKATSRKAQADAR